MDNMNSANYISAGQLFDYAAEQAVLLTPEGETSGLSEAKRLQHSFRDIRRSHEEIA